MQRFTQGCWYSRYLWFTLQARYFLTIWFAYLIGSLAGRVAVKRTGSLHTGGTISDVGSLEFLGTINNYGSLLSNGTV